MPQWSRPRIRLLPPSHRSVGQHVPIVAHPAAAVALRWRGPAGRPRRRRLDTALRRATTSARLPASAALVQDGRVVDRRPGATACPASTR